MEISSEPWKKLIIHKVIEYQFGDWVKQIAFRVRSLGVKIHEMQWTNAIVFPEINYPRTSSTIDEESKGILRQSSVSFALKDKFEKQIVKGDVTINLVDVSINEGLKVVTRLKSQSKYLNPELVESNEY